MIVLVVLALAAYVLKQSGGGRPIGNSPGTSSQSPPAPTRTVRSSSEADIIQAFRERRSDFVVQSSGTIKKVLPDDHETPRHMRCIVRLEGGHTVLIAHNIDLADRPPVEEGQPIEFKGEYEWSEEGGVIHWTHHDPANRHQDGWLRYNGKLYQ